ncbi:MAG: Protein AmpG [Candidatus Erwinia impunctatus]|nr:Protein AmpG [Culicoides impunctatus]
MPRTYLHLFTQRNAAILLTLGFASGLPLALTSSTLQAWLAVENIDTKTVGFFSLVGQAYVFKFLWSPIMDRFTPSLLGRRRGWLLITQLLLLLTIALMGFMEPSRNLTLVAALAVLIAFCSASQDIVFDAWKTDTLQPAERGSGAAISVLGYRLAMLVSGGVALWLADRFVGWHAIWWLMAAMMLPGIVATLCAREPLQTKTAPRSLEEAIVAPLRDFFQRNNAWLILLLIIFYKLGDAFAASLTTLFLIKGVGFDAGEVGLVNKTLGLIATLIGALAGGLLMQRLSLFRALLIFGILQAVSNLSYWMLAVTSKDIYSMGAAVFVENLCGGMGTAAFVALLMTLCNSAFSATQFALLSALAAIGRVYVGPVAGWLVELWGWATFYAFTVVMAFPGLLVLLASRDTLQHSQQSDQFLPRQYFSGGYRGALILVFIGLLSLIFWSILTFFAPDNSVLSWLNGLLGDVGIVFLLSGIITGAALDNLAVRKSRIS